MIYNVQVQIEGENGHADALTPGGSGPSPATLQYTGGTMDDQPSAYDDEEYAEGGEASQVVQQRRVEENEQLGRNDPCWCGSGKKFKKCHGA
jgi:preprotein translocase subunit SecA